MRCVPSFPLWSSSSSLSWVKLFLFIIRTAAGNSRELECVRACVLTAVLHIEQCLAQGPKGGNRNHR
uniref:Putative secreted protein n=1 Tax=Anopheles darlingi TaxID=43151 RepID=A0A2M4DKL5_ANODA